MKQSIVKFMWLICGIILVFAGIASMFNPTGTIFVISYVLALALIICGLLQVILFAAAHDNVFGRGWVLTEGILNIIIGILLLCDRFLAEAAIPAVFGMWMLVSGISKTVFSFDLKKLDMLGWGWMLLAGVIGVLVGFLSFFHPLVAGIAMGFTAGVIFILQGILCVFVWFYAMHHDA